MKKGMYFIQVTDLVKTKKEDNLLLIFQQHQMGQIYVKKRWIMAPIRSRIISHRSIRYINKI